MTITHTENSTRYTKGLRTFFTLFNAPAKKGITKIVDEDGSIFELTKAPITDAIELSSSRKKAYKDLFVALGRGTAYQVTLAVGAAAIPYLVGSVARSIENIKPLVSDKPVTTMDDVKRGKFLASGVSGKCKLIANEIRDGFIPERSEIENGLDMLKGSLGMIGFIIGALGTLGAIGVSTHDGSQWEAIDKSGVRIPL